MRQKIGKLPGTLQYTGSHKVEKSDIRLIKYDPDGFEVKECSGLEEAFELFDTAKVNWLKIEGYDNVELIQQVGKQFSIHPLFLEDILNVHQMPKIEISDNYLYATLKQLNYDPKSGKIEQKHISFILGHYYLLTFQEHVDDFYKEIRERIASATTKVKQRKADYLFYYLIDLIVDHYYIVFEELNKQVDQLEIQVMEDQDTRRISDIIRLKNLYSELRKNIEPVLEFLRDFKKSETSLAEDYIFPYFNDIMDHVQQYLETIRIKQENLASMVDLAMSVLSTKMNRVMYILTIVMTIFTPLTFLVGIYGMNFSYMPELGYKYGYFTLLGFMLLLGVGILVYMKRKKWF